MLELSINGTTKQLQTSSTIAELVIELDLTGKRIAIERNGEIVPRSLFAHTPLHHGDQLEIVVAVGGG